MTRKMLTMWLVLQSATVILPAQNHATTSSRATLLESYKLPRLSLSQFGNPACTATMLEQARQNGLKFADLPSIGSGLAKVGAGEFVGITDRGPNGLAETSNGASEARRTFPLPQFCPTIVRFKLAEKTIRITEFIPLHDHQGRRISGLSNVEGEERLYESGDAKAPLPLDENGVDPEAIRVLPDGNFLLSEEYSPSLLVVSPHGEVLVRYTPATKPLTNATYPVKAILPAVLSQRRTNRGFESLALSTDGKTAYAMLQSPAGDETIKAIKQSRVSRTIRLDLSDPLNARVTGHFLMPLSPAAGYGPDQKQQNVKLNDAEWIGPEKLLVLEEGKSSGRLIVADFSRATDLHGRPEENSLAFETAGDDLSKLTVQPATTETCCSLEGIKGLSHKLEGLAVLSPTEIAVSNDNDFGIGDNETGASSMVWIIRLPHPLPLAAH